MEGFEGLITNEKLGRKSFSFKKNVDEEFQVLSHEIQSSFIHSCPAFSSMKVRRGRNGEWKRGAESGTNGTIVLSRLSYILFWLFGCLTRARTLKGQFSSLPPLHLWLLFFIQLFQAWIFIEEFFHFLFARAELFFKALATKLLHFSLRSEQLFGLWAHDNHFSARI